MKKIEPYDFQDRAARRAFDLAVKKMIATLIVSPGGSGKTVMAALIVAMAVKAKMSVLLLAHRREIVKQIHDHLRRCGLSDSNLSVIMADVDDYDPEASVQIASIDTFRVRTKRGTIDRPSADLIFVDEAQHVMARTWRKLIRRYRGSALIGATATPWRLDGKGLGDVFKEIVHATTHAELIQRGILAAPRMFVAPDEYLPILDDVRIQHGDYVVKQLEHVVNQSTLVGNVIDNWAEHARGWSTLVFAVSIEHSRHLMNRFRAAGVAADHVDGFMPLNERDRVLKEFHDRKTTVLCNCMVLAEGYDLPACKGAVFARPTRSLALYYQQAARAARAFGNLRPILLDHARNILEHGPPHLDREFSLEGLKKKRRGAHMPQAQVCPKCRAATTLDATHCPECGNELPTKLRAALMSETDEALIEVTRQIREERRARLEAFVTQKPDSFFRTKSREQWINEVLARWCGPEFGF